MEHLNRVVKTTIDGLANKTEKAIQRVGKCVGEFIHIMDAYDKQAGILVWVEHTTEIGT